MFNPFRIMFLAAMDSIPIFLVKDPNGHRHLGVRNRIAISAGPVAAGFDIVAWSSSNGRGALEIQIRDNRIDMARHVAGTWRKDRWRLMRRGDDVAVDQSDDFGFWTRGGRVIVEALGLEVREALAADEDSAYAAWKAKDDARKAAEAQASAGAN